MAATAARVMAVPVMEIAVREMAARVRVARVTVGCGAGIADRVVLAVVGSAVAPVDRADSAG